MFFKDAYQPKGYEDGQLVSNLTPDNYRLRMHDDFEDRYFKYITNFGATLRIEMMDDGRINNKALQSIFIGGCIYDAFLVIKDYKNILVVPSWVDNPEARLNRLTQGDKYSFLPYGGSGIHSFPLIHFYNQCNAKLNIACVRNGQSFFDHLYESYAGISNRINTLRCDTEYVLGDDEWVKRLKGHNLEEKYDAVVLLDVPHHNGEKYKGSELKKDFAHLCVDDFDLIQFNSSEQIGDRVTGEQNNNEIIQKLRNIITPMTLRKQIRRDSSERGHGQPTTRYEVSNREDGSQEVTVTEILVYERTVLENSFVAQINNIGQKIRVY